MSSAAEGLGRSVFRAARESLFLILYHIFICKSNRRVFCGVITVSHSLYFVAYRGLQHSIRGRWRKGVSAFKERERICPVGVPTGGLEDIRSALQGLWFRDSRRLVPYGCIQGKNLHIGMPCGKSGRHARARPDHYTTASSICQ